MTNDIIPLVTLGVPPIAIRPGSTPPAIATELAQEKAPPARAPSLILMGRDERTRPHASVFTAADAEAAKRAAGLMGLRAVTVTEAIRSLAADLPRGRLFASGKAFVPFCSAQAFADLLAVAGLPDTPAPFRAAGKAADAPPGAGAGSAGLSGSDGGDGAGKKRPATFDEICIGSVVLACQGPMEGWWEAVVTHTKADRQLILRWRDFPSDPEFTRACKDLGLPPLDSLAGLR